MRDGVTKDDFFKSLVGGKLPILNKCKATEFRESTITQYDYIHNCIPLYNTKNAKMNIFFVNNNKKYFLHYYNPTSPVFEINLNTLEMKEYKETDMRTINKTDIDKINKQNMHNNIKFDFIGSDEVTKKTINILYYFVLY